MDSRGRMQKNVRTNEGVTPQYVSRDNSSFKQENTSKIKLKTNVLSGFIPIVGDFFASRSFRLTRWPPPL